MKRIILSFLLIAGCSVSCFAQANNYGALEWDLIRLGYVVPVSDLYGIGLALSGEPRFNLADDISLSLQGEMAIYGGGEDESIDIGGTVSASLFGDYYFATDSNSRGFAGLGIGYFAGISQSGSDLRTGLDAGASMGFTPRIGYEFGFIRLSGEYNLVINDAVSDYMGVHLGLTIGGRYKG